MVESIYGQMMLLCKCLGRLGRNLIQMSPPEQLPIYSSSKTCKTLLHHDQPRRPLASPPRVTRGETLAAPPIVDGCGWMVERRAVALSDAMVASTTGWQGLRQSLLWRWISGTRWWRAR